MSAAMRATLAQAVGLALLLVHGVAPAQHAHPHEQMQMPAVSDATSAVAPADGAAAPVVAAAPMAAPCVCPDADAATRPQAQAAPSAAADHTGMAHAHDAQAEGVAHGDVHARDVGGDATPADTASTAPMARGELRRADARHDAHAAHVATMRADMPPTDADPAVAPVGAAQAAHSAHSDHADHATRDRAMPDHAGMQQPATAPAAPTQQPSTTCTCADAATTALPREPIPPITDADRAAAFPALREHTMQHGPPRVGYLLLDRLEGWDTERGSGQAWEASAWYGGDIHRLWLRSEGERSGGHTEAADLEALYGRAVSPWWDLLVGVKQDVAPGGARTSAAFGVQGMAPYKFEVAATLYVGEGGSASARLEGEYDVLLTNRWILQPRLEAEATFADDRAHGIGNGLSTVEAGLRLRYEISRRVAPYLGVVHERAFGATADYRRDAGESARDTRVVAGVRVWF